MRVIIALRLLTLLAFAFVGGALPVAASGDHVVICGADGVKRVVTFDFETGQPVEVEIAEPECQDCFGFSPVLPASRTNLATYTVQRVERFSVDSTRMSRRPDGQPTARGPPTLIM